MSAVDDDPLRPYLERRQGFDPDAMLYLAVSVLAGRAALAEANINEQGQYRRGAQDAYIKAINRIRVTRDVGYQAAQHIARLQQERAEVWADVLDGDLKEWINDPTEWSA